MQLTTCIIDLKPVMDFIRQDYLKEIVEEVCCGDCIALSMIINHPLELMYDTINNNAEDEENYTQDKLSLIESQVYPLVDGVKSLYESVLSKYNLDLEYIDSSRIIKKLKDDNFLICDEKTYDRLLESDLVFNMELY